MDKEVAQGSDLLIGLGQMGNGGCDLSYPGLPFSEQNISQTHKYSELADQVTGKLNYRISWDEK